MHKVGEYAVPRKRENVGICMGMQGARFAGKYTCPSNDGCAACITTSADKDDITIEWYER